MLELVEFCAVLIGSTVFSKVETTSNAAARLTGFFCIYRTTGSAGVDKKALAMRRKSTSFDV